MPSILKEAIIKTLCYADIFDYPLTLSEISKYLIGTKLEGKNWQSQLLNVINKIPQIAQLDNFYYLSGRYKIVSLRKKRQLISETKMEKAKKIAQLISLIPQINLIAVTGNLSLNNADEEDDIDLLIITKENKIWQTRFLVVSLAKLLGVYRQPDDGEIKNKICFNMFIDDQHLKIPKQERDLYTAHEVIQIRPLFIRNNGFQNFLSANSWIQDFLPNSLDKIKNVSLKRKYNSQSNLIEKILEKIQLWYMQKKRTTEIIQEGYLRFHPQDIRPLVFKKYQNNLSLFDVL